MSCAPKVACSCMPGVRVFTPRAARSYSRKVPKLRLKQKTIRATSLLCCMQHAVLSWQPKHGAWERDFLGYETSDKTREREISHAYLRNGLVNEKGEKDMLWNGWQGVKRGVLRAAHTYTAIIRECPPRGAGYTVCPPPPPKKKTLPNKHTIGL